ncbi:hypothetical protein [Nocardia wallacei]|uniref:hypothetical protein n=1 Tax=Nocardia wallacei TaxID=480035 RepID=UPI002454E589|nr:hypothetical protein [Nocardia wallacei]
MCDGSQLLDVAADELCGFCIGGLTEYDSAEEVAEAERRAGTLKAPRGGRHLRVVSDVEYVVADRAAASQSATVAPPSVRSVSGQVFYGGF